MPGKYFFKSTRLGFRNWEDGDIEPMVALNADPINMEFFEFPRTREQTCKSIEDFKTRHANGELSLYAVDRLDTNVFIGMIGFGRINFDSWISPCIEIGWRLDKAHWGMGFATEGAKACLANFWRKYPNEDVRAITALENKRSERVMIKLGMEAIGFFEHPKVSEGHRLRKHICYEIRRKPIYK